MTKPRVGSGISYGAIAHADHARKAVVSALKNAGLSQAGSVCLFLSPAYAYEPQEALREAAKAAGTPQIFGCCSLGLLHQHEWVLDAEGAVAMVFPPEFGLIPLAVAQQRGLTSEQVFTLSSPNAVEIAINSVALPQVGAVVTDEYGHGPFSLWQSGNIVEREYTHTVFSPQLQLHTLYADSLETLSPPLQLNKAEHFDLQQIELMPATKSLAKFSGDLLENQHLLCIVSKNNSDTILSDGDYELHQVVAQDPSKGTVSLSATVRAGRYITWARRNPVVAEQKLEQLIQQHEKQTKSAPDFAILLSNVSRGAEFYGGDDQDLALFQHHFPKVPMIGFYSNAELHPDKQGRNKQFHHCSLLMLAYTQK